MDRVEMGNLPAGSRIRIGVPAERPEAALAALVNLFSARDDVISARLGLMEVIDAGGSSEFSYIVGIECGGDANAILAEAAKALEPIPAARWPIDLMLFTREYFPPEAIVFFGNDKARGWFSRLFSGGR
jgi:SseB protein C-terminal domain